MNAAQPERRSMPRLICRTTAIDPAAAAPLLADAAVVWISPGAKLQGAGAAWTWSPAKPEERFRNASAELKRLFSEAEIEDEVDAPGSGPVAFGSFAFDSMDPHSLIVVPSLVVGMNDTGAWKTEIRAEGSPAGEMPLRGTRMRQGSPDDSAYPAWTAMLERAKQRLGKGDLQKVVLSRQVRVPLGRDFEPSALIQKLAGEFPGCYTFRFGNLIGASPELLVRKLGTIVDSMPLAGSAPRGSNEVEDERLGRELKSSAKNLEEHDLTKSAVVSALGRFCKDLEVEPQPSLLLLSNVQHLSTKVQGVLSRQADCLELVEALHPTPAVCGVPPRAALDLIRSIEKAPRGRYAGPVGWMDHRGDGEWAIALRCAEIQNLSATLFAGAGILAESNVLEEFDETELKLLALRKPLEEANLPR